MKPWQPLKALKARKPLTASTVLDNAADVDDNVDDMCVSHLLLFTVDRCVSSRSVQNYINCTAACACLSPRCHLV